MGKPYLRLLSDDELRSIHSASLRILEETGMLIDHQEARERLEGAGARVDHQTKMVRFPPELVEAKRQLVPHKLLHAGRDPEFDFVVETGGDIYSRTAGGATEYVDLGTGERRRATLDDWKEFARLADALPNINSLGTLHCGGIPEHTADLHSLRVLLENQRKNIVHNAFSLGNFRLMIEMMVAVRGNKEALQERPLVHHIISPISPLYLNEDDTSQLLLACENGIPTDIPIMPTAGSTGPITIAGTLALANAEFLGTMTLAQTARPGHGMPYFLDPMVADMSSGTPLMGAPEVALLNAAIAQMAIFYDLPAEGIGLDSDSLISGQTQFEKAMNMILQCLAGGKLVIGAGVVETCMAASPAQLVIDDEIIAIARRLLQGMQVDECTLAVEAIGQVGPRGNFLMADHTLDHLRTGELIRLQVFSRDRHDVWVSKGSPSLEQTAAQKGLAILAKHEVPPLPDHVVQELRAIANRPPAH